MSDTVAAVVVTYNRKELLIECLEALRNQTHKPDAIFIIDNKSNDGTPNLLLEKKYISKLPVNDSSENQLIKNQLSSLNIPSENIEINYVRKFENDGGAGGFYEGMKRAYEAGYDWLWMMDDDGIADNNQLKELLDAPQQYKYRNALVIDIKDNSKLAFGLRGYSRISEIAEKNIIENETNPFNGTFIHKEIPHNIGLIKKEMFIWGDETEYMNRTKKNGFEIATIIKAKHYHPKNKGKTETILPFINKGAIVIKPKNLSHIYFRNLGFIQKEYLGKFHIIKTVLSYTLYFFARLKFYSLIKFVNFYFKGLRNDYR